MKFAGFPNQSPSTNYELTDQEREELEGYITIEECAKVLKTFPPGKSPGDDGFTAEFYTCFFDLVSHELVNSFNTAYKEGELSISQRRGVITRAQGRLWLVGSLKLATNYSFKFRLQDRIKSNSKEKRKDFTKNNSS